MGYLSRIKDLQDQYNDLAATYQKAVKRGIKPIEKQTLEKELSRLLKAIRDKIIILREKTLSPTWEVHFLNVTRSYEAKMVITSLKTSEEVKLFLREYFRFCANEIIEILEIKEIPTFERISQL